MSRIAEFLTAVSVILLVSVVFFAPVSATEDSPLQISNDSIFNYTDIRSQENFESLPPAQGATPLPAAYDLRDLGLVTPPKKQGPFGSCWAFSVISSIESNAIKKGYETNLTADFSEVQLMYFMYNRSDVTTGNVLPALSGLKGDYVIVKIDDNCFNLGGNRHFAALHLATGIGVIRESDAPYEWAKANPNLTLSPEYAVDKNVYVVSNAYFVSPVVKDDVKKLLTKYGCCSIAYYDDDDCYNETRYKDKNSTAYYQINKTSTNHAVSLVGWDDNYPKENFKIMPENDGAWLIKNSWGPLFGDDGYFWLSYEDPSINEAVFFEVRKPDSFDNIYQYDGTGMVDYHCWNNSDGSGFIKTPVAGNVFTAKDNEKITDVSFATFNKNVGYDVAVLRADGSVASTESGFLEYSGYHTVPLSKPVNVAKDEVFTVAVSFTAAANTSTIYGKDGLAFPIDKTNREIGPIEFISESQPGQGYLDYGNGCIEDVCEKDGGNLRIKAFTTNLPTISAASLSLSSDIAVRFYVNDSSLTGYRDVYLNATFNGTQYTLLPVQDPDNPRKMFVFKHISPAEMNETVSVKLYATKDGETYPELFDSLNYSIKDYCVNQMDKAGVKNSLTTLCVDLLNYGSASQVYLGETDSGKLVNNTLSDEQKSWASLKIVPETRNDKFVSEEGSDSVGVWRSASLNLYSDISLVFKFTTELDVSDLEAEIKYGVDLGETATVREFTDSTYSKGPCKQVVFNKMNAQELNYPAEITLVNKATGERSKTLVYSVDAYSHSKMNGGGSLGDLVISIMKYIRSVDKFA